MELFGYTFLVSTTLLLIFKRENDNNNNNPDLPVSDVVVAYNKHNIEDHLSVKGTYRLMWSLLFIMPVKRLIIILLTFKVEAVEAQGKTLISEFSFFFILKKIGFATESMIVLKLIEYGVPREKLSLLAVPLAPLQIILPLLISK